MSDKRLKVLVFHVLSPGRDCCIVIALATLWACTRSASLTVELPPNYTGTEVTVDLCVPGIPSIAQIDKNSHGQTSTCIKKQERLRVISVEGNKRTEIAQERTHVETTGDGISVSVKFSR